jgi:hypothetical protein
MLDQLTEAVDEHLQVADSVHAALQTTRGEGQTTLLLNMILRMETGILIVGSHTLKASIILNQGPGLRDFLNRHIVTIAQVNNGALRGRREPLFWDNSAIQEFLPSRLKAIRLLQTEGRPLPEEPSDVWTWYDALNQNEESNLGTDPDSTHT